MQWRMAVACTLSLAALTGCPHAFLKRDGTLDRAARKDTEQSLDSPACTEDVYKELCLEGGQERAEACFEVCGE